MGTSGFGYGDQRPGSGDLLQTLVAGLDQTEREDTLRLLRRRLVEDRAAACGGQRDRQVDVGPRTRAARGPTKSQAAGIHRHRG
ncbi:hypothetical protein ThrDRAFT_01349 [Frankia casuarinae]|uniref:Uncharacterized protein n=1 Tax=Frankia casuarinae (strain DSM 45818 / CECT 9043 / HFP020203 / CcI3) TaxID=106370 RepID=Q2JG69_FRACC|nr:MULTISPECIES: hypothetical protein [Frankia]ABD09723.1 hypothetical protein Francci3_0336 [Frankia casuarinae]ETA02295.1 hypothetical protein CcI6DRAFT_02284 [Frankia sp. CcI6]EYT92966.1 hypothetical protein ThrDRAFT_01349 [Frankia casuarinae]KDA43329.1 hypothetical protein BMG523Draft_01830 [Frankia sp. BMG5.23]KEZ36707.1 hypothetical protein CEDDRAFT_01887 [Frankia sp. CeD]